jgi:nifR3 family TIM-barrel protein
MNIWQNLKNKNTKRPLVVLAPMADVTDPAFRKLIAKYGKPDALWTEFVSADALIMAPKKKKKTEKFSAYQKIFADLDFHKSEHPIISQLFSANPERMENACELVANLGFDGIDLNMGCPDKNIIKSGSGAGHIKDSKLAVEIILAAKRGILKSKNPNIALSVKTRIGFNKDELEIWLPKILKTNPALVTIHARTKKEMSLVPANWDRVKRAVEIRDEIQANLPNSEKTLIFGNGDVKNVEEAFVRAKETNCDGVMIGRGIFGKPWLFENLNQGKNHNNLSFENRLKILIEHIKLFEKLVPHKNFNIMKKHFKAYVEGFDGAKELRINLMESQNAKGAIGVLKNFLKN